MNESTLCTLYEIASRKPGWLAKIQAVCELTEEQVGFLEWLDEQESQVNKKLREMEGQMRREGFDEELIDCNTDDERMAKLNKLIFTITDAHEEMRSMDKPYIERALHLLTHRYDHWVKLRNKIQRRIIHTTPGTITASPISDADIERARAVPMEEIVEPVRGYVHCLWHKDGSPSMWVKDGFGWCFACNAWSDSIKWWMKKNGRNFVEAVQALSRI
jgi:hypothetical protein